MDNTWYYTLSTIAQTLAAILGLAVVFVTIRLQNITEKLKEYKRRGEYIVKKKEKHITKKFSKISERTASGLYKELQDIEENYYDKYEKDSGFISDIAILARSFEPNHNLDNISFLRDTYNYLGIYIKQRNRIMESVKWPGIISSGTIIYAIFLLSTSNFYSKKSLISLLFILAVGFSIFSIFSIARASWGLLKDSVQKV